jgi:hypothetical protein
LPNTQDQAGHQTQKQHGFNRIRHRTSSLSEANPSR